MNGELHIEIAVDMMSARACIFPGDNEITEDYVRRTIYEAGVTMGVNEDSILALINATEYEKWVDIAVGREAGETTPGYFEYFFEQVDNTARTIIDEKGNVNYGKKRVMVYKGDKLATYHRSVAGTFGYTVLSTVIASKPVKNYTLKCREGVEQIENDFYATQDGEVILKRDSISVSNLLVIEGNAKFGYDSNTNFVGNVLIKGDVLKGVTIEAAGNVEILGTLEANNIFAGKDIIVHGGIKGDSNDQIKAGGSIICPYVENATLIADGNIEVDTVMHSHLKAGDSIRVHGRRGVIIGGDATAKNTIEIDHAGNNKDVGTKLYIANDDHQSLQFSKIIVHDVCNEYVNLAINDRKYCAEILENMEYHYVNSRFVVCKIGQYVPEKEIDSPEEKPVKKTVLLVDDEPMILKTYYGFLKDKYDVLLASSAKDALAILEKGAKKPDLILLDYVMPEINGAQFLSAIRKTTWKDYSSLPVIFVTAMSDKSIIVKCLSLYPQGYLIKPIGQEDLIRAVDNYFASEKETDL